MWKDFARFIFHTAYLLILSGALITHMASESGIIHLRTGETSVAFVSTDNDEHTVLLPFAIRLDSFRIVNYPGTDTPSDYVSHISLSDEQGERTTHISMNNILKHDGYRIFQQSYDPDGHGSLLMVSHDPWGTSVTYTGYILLLIGMMALLFSPRSIFRDTLKKGKWKCWAFLPLIIPGSIQYADATPKTFPPTDAEAFGEILVQYNGRITSLESLSIDFTRKIHGSDHYGDFTATQFLAGYLLSREDWNMESAIKLKDEKEKEILGTDKKYVSIVDFYTVEGLYKPKEAYGERWGSSLNSPEKKALRELDEKMDLILSLQNRELLKIFPYVSGGKTRLVSFHELQNADTLLRFLPELYERYSKNVPCDDLIRAFIKTQKERLGEAAPTESALTAEKIHIRVNHLPWCCHLTLFAGLCLFLLLFLNQRGWLEHGFKIGYAVLSLCTLYLTFLIILRSMVSGRLPLSNGHETLLCIAWISQIFTLFLFRKVKIILPLGLIASGFALLTATMGESNPQITALMPVLNSPILSIHVSLMMIAYALLLIVTLSSLSVLVLHYKTGENERLEIHQDLNTILLYPAVFCLTAGIFTGAVWANVSWGSYWSWDPKETWALISLLVYSLIFHRNSIPTLNKPIVFHLYLIGAFLFILITYFGVNYFFGGMHSYGG